MSAYNCHGLRNARNDQPFRRRVAHWQNSVVEGDYTRAGHSSAVVRHLNSSDTVSAPVTVIDYSCKSGSLLNASRIVSRHQDGHNHEFVNARVGARDNTALLARRKSWQLFGCKAATLTWSKRVQLDMPFMRCLEETEYVGRLSTIVVSLSNS